MNAPFSNSPRFSEADEWITSNESPEATEPTGRETMPRIATHLREQFGVSLPEAIQLVTQWSVANCDAPASDTEVAQIVRRTYSADRAPTPAAGQQFSSKLEAALEAMRRGFNVFPLVPNTKRPAIEQWQHAATKDVARITQWWTENPDYNIGISMDGYAAVDIDTRHGGWDTFKELSLTEDLPNHRTLLTRTASNGAHMIYSVPEGERLKNGANKFGQGIDLKTGAGAYLVAPGSTIGDKAYSWTNDRPIALMPPGLLERARGSAPTTKSSAAGKRLVEEDDDAVRLATNWLTDRAPDGEAGSRDNTAFKVAAKLYDFGVSKTTALELLHEWNERRCSPPLEPEELERIADSAGRNRSNPIGVRHPANAEGFEPVEIAPRTQGARGEFETGKKDEPLARPYVLKDPTTIPPREWLIPGILCRRNLSILAGPPGVSKTTLLLTVALALVTGREDLLGLTVKKRCRVWFWNQEDPLDELERRIAAICLAFGVSDEDLLDADGKPMLWLNSGVDEPLLLATVDGNRKMKRGNAINKMIEEIRAKKIDVVLLDPMVEFHEAEESDNAQMRKVMGCAREIIVATGCAGYIGTHTRKPDKSSSKGFAGDMDAIRGASAQVGAARIVHTLLLASADDAKRWGMEDSHLNYVRLDMAKNNLGRRWAEPRWFKFDEIPIGMERELVGVLRPAHLAGEAEPDRLEILAAAMKAAGLEEARASVVISMLPEHQKRLFGKTKANWSREVQKAFVGPPGAKTEHGTLSWSCAGERSPTMLHLQSASSAQSDPNDNDADRKPTDKSIN